MILNKENTLKVLNRNFGFPIVENPVVGKVVELKAVEAYFYSAVTGHNYLNAPQGFSPNGLMYVFNQANSFNLITGLFDRDGSFRNTPLIHSQSFPFIKNSPKYLLPLEYKKGYRSFIEKCSDISKRLSNANYNPADFLICRIDLSTRGYHMEPFCEYIASKYFNQHGYLTETQIPFYYSGGTPDFAAYDIPNVNSLLRKYNLILNGSSFINLALIRVFNQNVSTEEKTEESKEAESIVGEAKTSTLRATEQIKKYLSFGVFNKAYEIIPNKVTPEVISGLISFDEQGYIRIQEAKQPAVVKPEAQQKYLSWLSNYIKYFLIANLTNQEFDEFYGEITSQTSRTLSQLIEFVNSLQYEQIIERIKLISKI